MVRAQSPQSYVRGLLDREAATLTAEEVSRRAREIASRSSVTADDVITAIEDARRDPG